MDNKILVIGLIKTDMVIPCTDSEKKLETDFSSKDSKAIQIRSDTKLIGCIGEGMFEMSIVRNYTENHANSDNIINVPGICAGATLTITKNVNTYTVTDNRVSTLHTADIINSLEEVIRDIDLVIINLEISIEAVEKVIDFCKRHNVRSLLYPAPARRIPDDLISKIDIIVADANNVEIITGITIHQLKNAISAVKFLLDKDTRQVVLILGSQGIIYNDGVNIIHKTFPDSHRADTSFDLFIGVLAVYIALGKNINEAINLASIVNSAVGLK